MTHACYLLRSLNPRFKTSFYIGCTTDPRRRLRQHNGEVAQGAHFTKKKRPWEMVLCVYGFTSHVNALKFEWAWQHPLVSLAVKEAAAKLPSLKGVPGMIRLVCTMVTLPRWSSLNLTLQFMLSSLLQHRHGSPPLPPQMRLFVASIDSLPGKDSGDDNDDNDDLSTCPDELSQSLQFDENSYLNASSCTADVQERVTEDGSTAELYTSHDITSPPCPKKKGKKSRKGKTPQGRKGKRGATHKVSDDPILIDLQIKGIGSTTFYAGEEKSARHEVNDCTGDPRMTLTTVETMCSSSRSQGETIDCYRNTVDLSYLFLGERIPLYLDSEDDSHRSLEIDCSVSGCFSTKDTANTTSLKGSQEKRAGSDEHSKEDLTDRSIGERIPLEETSKFQSSRFENRASVMTLSMSETTLAGQSSRCQWTDCSTVSEDLSYWSIAETILSQRLVKDHGSERSTLNGGGSLCASITTKADAQVKCSSNSEGENIDFHTVSEEHNMARCSGERGTIDYGYGVSDDLSSKSIGERISSDGVLEDQSQKPFVHSSLVEEGDSGAKSTSQKSDAGDSDIEEISVEEFQTAGVRRKEFVVPFTRSTKGDARCLLSSISDTVPMIAREKNLLEVNNLKGVEMQQKSLKTFFPVKKQGAVPTSIYRKSRNGEFCKVLEDHSNTRNARNWVESKGECSGILPDSKGSCKERIQDAALIIDSDDDEIQEISVTEFKQGTFVGKVGVTGRKEIVCSLSSYR